MSVKLTDAQIVMMSAAAQRKDRCMSAPATIKGVALSKVGVKLAKLGLAREIGAKPGAPIWRRDDAGQGYALKLTAAGLKAVEEGSQDTIEPSEAAQPEAKNVAGPNEGGHPALVYAPRDGSKLALVIEHLQRADGATIIDLTQAAGWLPHTTRAALTGLRKRGYAVPANGSALAIPSTGSRTPRQTGGIGTYCSATRWMTTGPSGRRCKRRSRRDPRASELRACGESSHGGNVGRFPAARCFRFVDRRQPRRP